MEFEQKIDLTTLKKGFEEFDEYINKNNKNLSEKFIPHHGYLINLSKFEELKKRINEEYRNNYLSSNKIPIDNNSKRDYTIDEIEFRDSNYLLNMILNGNKYIFINEKLWQLLCKKDKKDNQSIIYEINYFKIKFQFSGESPLFFSNSKKNIICDYYEHEIPNFSLYKNNYNNIKYIIYSAINNYYDYEKTFKIYLSFSSKPSSSGFLVDIEWFNNWKKFYNFDFIKSKYLVNKKEGEEEKVKKKIINHLIYMEQFNKKNNFKLEEPKIYDFKQKSELFSFLKTNKGVLINTSLITSSTYLSDKVISFFLGNKEIEFHFTNHSPIIIHTEDNIIILNSPLQFI